MNGTTLLRKGALLLILAVISVSLSEKAQAQANVVLDSTDDKLIVFDWHGEIIDVDEVNEVFRDSRGQQDGDAICNAGIFEVTFEDILNHSGFDFDNNSTGPIAKATFCKVLEDLSALLNTGNIPTVRVLVRSNYRPNNVTAPWIIPPGSTAIAGARPYYVRIPFVNEGVVSEITREIITTKTNPLSFLAQLGYNVPDYHCEVVVNFNMNFNADYQNTSSSVIDLYSVLLHEMMHNLGIASLIDIQGVSVMNPKNLFSEWDTRLRLRATNAPLIGNQGQCYMYSITTATYNDALVPCSANSSSVLYDFRYSAQTEPIYSSTAGSYEDGSTFSHLHAQCGANANYVMHPSYQGMQRTPTTNEVQILCDLGYEVTGIYGANSSGCSYNNCATYNIGSCHQSTAGVIDLYTTTAGSNTLQINPLSNDLGAPNRIGCLEVVYPDPQVLINGGAIPATLTQPFQILLNPSYPLPGSAYGGLIIMRYVPKRYIGNLVAGEGNETYIFINVTPNFASCVNNVQCSYIFNGDFESGATPPDQVEASTNFGNFVSCWAKGSLTPDLYERNHPNGFYAIPYNAQTALQLQFGNTFQPATTHDNDVTNTRFVGMWNNYGCNPNHNNRTESIYTRLAGTLTPGNTYYITFWTNVSDLSFDPLSCPPVPTPRKLRLKMNLFHPNPNAPTFDFYTTGTNPADYIEGFVLPSSANDYGWVKVFASFVYNPPPGFNGSVAPYLGVRGVASLNDYSEPADANITSKYFTFDDFEMYEVANNISIDLSVNDPVPVAGSTITFAVRVCNHDQQPVTGTIKLHQHLPPCISIANTNTLPFSPIFPGNGVEYYISGLPPATSTGPHCVNFDYEAVYNCDNCDAVSTVMTLEAPGCVRNFDKVKFGTPLQDDIHNYEVCTGNAIEINATMAGLESLYDFTWSPTVGLSNPNILNPSVSVTSNTQYTLSYSDKACNTNFSATFVVNVLPPFQASITANQNECAGIPIELQAQVADVSYNPIAINWSTNAVPTTANGFTASAIPLQGSNTYSITVTDAKGCQRGYSIEVAGISCCVGDSVFVQGQPLSLTFTNVAISELPPSIITPTGTAGVFQINPALSAYQIAFNGDIDIDRTLVSINNNVLMGENSRLVINDGNSLGLIRTTIRGCDAMWDGIYIEGEGNTPYTNPYTSAVMFSGEGLFIEGGGLMDAKAAVRSINGHYYNLNTAFDNNFCGIRIEPNNAQPFLGYVRNSSFTNSTGTLLPPHAGERSFAGVEVLRSGEVSIGSGNEFTGIRTGIRSWMSSLSVSPGNTFHDMVGNAAHDRTGILAAGAFIPTIPGAFYSLSVQGTDSDGDGIGDINNFTNLKTGIWTSSMSSQVNANYFKKVATPVRSDISTSTKLIVEGNRFEDASAGAVFNSCFGSHIIVNHNDFVRNNPVFSSGTGVRINSYSGKLQYSLIADNNFVNLRRGVDLLNVQGAGGWTREGYGMHILRNTFDNENSLTNQQAHIYETKCSSIHIANNIMKGNFNAALVSPFSASTNYRMVGIHSQQSPNAITECNVLDNLSAGMRFIGNNTTDPTYLSDNIFNRHAFGLTLERFGMGNNGDIGDCGKAPVGASPGISNGNLFDNNTGQFAFSMIYGRNNNYAINSPKWFYHPSDGLLPGLVGSNNGQSVVVNNNNINPGELSDCGDVGSTHDLSVLSADEIEKAEAIADNSALGYVDPMFSEVVKFNEEKLLYEKLKDDAPLRGSSSTLQSFFETAKEGSIGKTDTLEQKMEAATDSTTLTDSSLYWQKLLEAKQQNSEAPGTKQHEQNLKLINEVYFRTLAEGKAELDNPADVSLIVQLAYSCPLIAGDAVYHARALYSLINDTMDFEDLDICDGFYKKERPEDPVKVSSVYSVDLFPNPASDVVYLAIDLDPLGSYEVSVFDALGQKLSDSSITGGRGMRVLPVANLSAGIYTVVVSDKKDTFTKRLTIGR